MVNALGLRQQEILNWKQGTVNRTLHPRNILNQRQLSQKARKKDQCSTIIQRRWLQRIIAQKRLEMLFLLYR